MLRAYKLQNNIVNHFLCCAETSAYLTFSFGASAFHVIQKYTANIKGIAFFLYFSLSFMCLRFTLTLWISFILICGYLMWYKNTVLLFFLLRSIFPTITDKRRYPFTIVLFLVPLSQISWPHIFGLTFLFQLSMLCFVYNLKSVRWLLRLCFPGWDQFRYWEDFVISCKFEISFSISEKVLLKL